MKYTPHSYQAYCTSFILSHPIAALFLDCGLGKTVITLTAIASLLFDSFEVQKVLIIAPIRVANHTWPSEIEKWEHLKCIRYSVCTGTPAQREAALKQDADVYIINRENIPWLVENGFFDFDMVVVDELSSFKNHSAKRYRALRKVRPLAKRIVGLTGTPASNGLMDLFAEIGLLDMGERFGKFITYFRNAYFLPDKRNQNIIFSYKPQEGAEERIYGKIADICISMKSKDVLKMPPLTINNIYCELSEKERALYESLKRDMILSFPEADVDAVNAAALSNKLQQMANGRVYDEKHEVRHIHSRKLEALEDLVEAANGKPVLVAYWFKHDLEQIKESKVFSARCIDTKEDIDDWNAGKIPVALIHPASAGHGLNLQNGGSTIVWYGLTWSLELYQQLNARLNRQGQRDAVVIHHILSKGTIDEAIIKSLNKKDNTQEALIEAVKAELWR